MNKCCICNRNVDSEEASILAMGGGGFARYLCEECEGLMDTATRGREYDEIKAAVVKISDTMSETDPDPVTFAAVSAMMIRASKRATAIKEGTYDFSRDDEENEEEEILEEIPEELLESEEDKEKDRADEEKMKKFDKFYNGMMLGALIGLVGFIIWKIIDNFFL